MKETSPLFCTLHILFHSLSFACSSCHLFKTIGIFKVFMCLIWPGEDPRGTHRPSSVFEAEMRTGVRAALSLALGGGPAPGGLWRVPVDFAVTSR